MEPFQDYYEILQVHHLAEPEVVGAAYKKLAHKYHGDHNKSPEAVEKMKSINAAYEILSIPEKRKSYDLEWVKRKGTRPKEDEAFISTKLKPVVEITPSHIRFKDVGHLDTKTSYFEIKGIDSSDINYTIVKDRLPAWLEITEIQSLTNDLLPARVHIRVIGRSARTKCDCYIPIKIEDQEIKVHVELVMKGPALQIDRKLIEFSVIPDVIPLPQAVTLKNLGMGYIEGNLISRQKWIKVSPRSVKFTDKQDIQIQIDTAQLFVDIMGYIDVKMNCCDDVITVRASISHEGIKTRGK